MRSLRRRGSFHNPHTIKALDSEGFGSGTMIPGLGLFLLRSLTFLEPSAVASMMFNRLYSPSRLQK